MDVWDLLQCLARQPKWSLAVVKGDPRADIVCEKKVISRLETTVTYHERLCKLLPGNKWVKPSLLR